MVRRVLVLEDEPILAKHLVRLFSARGYEVHTAHTVATFLALARGGRFEVVLLDLLLPDGNGLDAWGEARAAQVGARAILMTAHGTPELACRARALGIHTLLGKPLQLSLLLSAVAEAGDR